MLDACCGSKIPALEWKKLPKNLGEEKAIEIQGIEDAVRSLPASYPTRPALRIVLIAAAIIGVAVAFMYLKGTLCSFPENFVRFFKNLNCIHVGIGTGPFVVLTIGAGLVIKRALNNQDKLTGKVAGSITGDEQWVPATYTMEIKQEEIVGEESFLCFSWGGEKITNLVTSAYVPGFIDKSTLNEQGNGKAFFYAYKPEYANIIVSSQIALAQPIHMVGAMAYNAIRLFVIPFVILLRMAVEKYRNAPLYDRYYEWKDIGIEMKKSFQRIIKAPFYAMAMIYASLYALLLDPKNGRKLMSYVERDWNEGVTRAEGWWSVGGAQKLWKLEGGGSPNHLGENGFYIAGCCQPMAVVYYENWKIKEDGDSLTLAVEKFKEVEESKYIGKPYKIYTEERMHTKYHEIADSLPK